MKKSSILMVVSLLFVTTGLFADGASAYKKCAGCHGSQGEKVALGKSKVLSNMSKQEIVDAMKGYQNGSYGGAMKNLMVAQVKGLNDADIQAIADMIGK